ncbi:hypothetical protein GJ496_009987 [Pomphorhynchus laevis]|nr:hypothetical protein GJ496_009987 [Pomphorhynchus laevis]
MSYDWSDKVYNRSDFEIPNELKCLANIFAEVTSGETWNYDSAIVNYYGCKDTLCPHTDVYEQELRCPIVTVSLGADGVFMIGGNDRFCQEPDSVLLKEGDVMIMSLEARTAVHAIPKIIASIADKPETDSDVISDFYLNNRVNISIRQVFKT